MSLAQLNAELEKEEDLPDEVWHEWLWGSDCEEACVSSVQMNRNHLLVPGPWDIFHNIMSI